MLLVSSLVVVLLARPPVDQRKLDAWFHKDSKGQSCASCHSVDGIELRSFAEIDIRRRTSRHHTGETAAEILSLLASHPRVGTDNGIDIRPMQPSGKVLAGKTPAERDNSFLVNLNSQHPTLFAPVRTHDQALAFQKEMLKIDIRQLPIGIELNRMSEDGFHGPAHQSIANWLPDVPSFDSDALRLELEAYRTNPTETNLELIDTKVTKIAKVNDSFTGLALAKYRALLVYQHELRTNALTTFLPKENPFWQVGEFGRLFAEADAISINVPADIIATKNLTSTFKAQLKQLRLPWFWLGWTRDPSLTKSGRDKPTVRADYFCRFLEEDGPYIGHESLMLARKMAEQGRNPLYPGIPFEILYSSFLVNTPLIDREPQNAKARHLFRQFTTNSFMMSLTLLEDDLKKSNKALHQVPQLNQIGYIRKYLNETHSPLSAQIDRIIRRLNSATGI